MYLINPESFTQIGSAMSESIGLKQQDLPTPLENSYRSLKLWSWFDIQIFITRKKLAHTTKETSLN